MGSVVLPISIQDAHSLLQQWGFSYEGGNGGHAIFSKDGKRVQFPGRRGASHAPVTVPMVRKAARICGVTMSEFRKGPPQVKAVMPDAPSVFDDVVVLEDVIGPPEVEVEPEVEPEIDEADFPPVHRGRPTTPWLSPTFRIFNYLKEREGQEVKLQRISAELKIKTVNANQALTRLIRDHPEVTKVARGTYRYSTLPTRPTDEELAAQAVENGRAKAQEAVQEQEHHRLYEQVGTDPHGRVVLKDLEGELWIAIRIEPSFFPFKLNGNGDH